MVKYEVDTVINAISGKKSRHFNYDFKILGGKERTILSVRHSKKGGSTLARGIYDLMYLGSKLDPYWLDSLVNDKDFPIILSQMQEAYKKKKLIGWSPETAEELKEAKKEIDKNENIHQ